MAEMIQGRLYLLLHHGLHLLGILSYDLQAKVLGGPVEEQAQLLLKELGDGDLYFLASGIFLWSFVFSTLFIFLALCIDEAKLRNHDEGLVGPPTEEVVNQDTDHRAGQLGDVVAGLHSGDPDLTTSDSAPPTLAYT
uniref:Uncharacterized protein n=1 Tax=Cannabis sativa TaxID=3483 RepID=A0A803PT42_CANSA